MGRPTMRDVGERAGVSPKTVSNVVRGWPPVSPRTEQRVKAALEELGYRMNQSPKMLRTGRSGIVAVAVPWLDNPYFAELTSAIVRRAAASGLTVLVEQTDGVLEREQTVVQGLPNQQPIDGLIFSPYAIGEEDLDALVLIAPTVLLGERMASGHGDHVAIDNVAAAVEVTAHLIQIGREQIATIGHQEAVGAATARQRVRGYELALRAAGRPLDPGLQMSVDSFGRSEGAAAMRRLLASGRSFDAVFCFSDLLALGAMHEVKKAGLRIPEDVAIAGFDDIEEGRYADPELTTIRPDKQRIANVALDLLMSRVADEEGSEVREVCSPYELVVRRSTSTEREPDTG